MILLLPWACKWKTWCWRTSGVNLWVIKLKVTDRIFSLHCFFCGTVWAGGGWGMWHKLFSVGLHRQGNKDVGNLGSLSLFPLLPLLTCWVRIYLSFPSSDVLWSFLLGYSFSFFLFFSVFSKFLWFLVIFQTYFIFSGVWCEISFVKGWKSLMDDGFNFD